MPTIQLLVLNYNGRHLLQECLPTVLRAAAMSRHDCQVAVIDNASSDGSAELLRREFPDVRLFHCENRGLCSFNTVLPQLDSQVVVLLNNDIKLARGSVDPLVGPFLPGEASDSLCVMTAPLCWLFDGSTYEGLQTALRWRWGLIQAISDYPGHQQVMRTACLTASAGAVMAVDRHKFLELGGFDALYLPGRIEDVDFCFRGYLAGYHARYVPESVAYHKGEATFRRELGAIASQTLALRNTLLFQWKNLRHPWHRLRHIAGLPPRFLADMLRAPIVPRERRFMFTRAFLAAIRRWRQADVKPARVPHDVRRERQLLKELHWTRFARRAAADETPAVAGADGPLKSRLVWLDSVFMKCSRSVSREGVELSRPKAMQEPTLVGFGRLPPALAGGLRRRMHSLVSRLQPGFPTAALALARRLQWLKPGTRSPAKAGSTMSSVLHKPPAKAGGKSGKPAKAGWCWRRSKIYNVAHTAGPSPSGPGTAQPPLCRKKSPSRTPTA